MIITYKGQPTNTAKTMTKEDILAAVPSGRCWVRPRELSEWLKLDSNSLGQHLSELGFGKAKIKTSTGVQDRVWYVGTTPIEGWTSAAVRSELRVNP